MKYRFVSRCHFQACACHFGSPAVSQAASRQTPDVLTRLGAGNTALCCSRDPCSFPTGCSSHNPPGCTQVDRRTQPKIAQMLPAKWFRWHGGFIPGGFSLLEAWSCLCPGSLAMPSPAGSHGAAVSFTATAAAYTSPAFSH